MPSPRAIGLESGQPGLAGFQIGTTSDGRPIIAWPASADIDEVLDPIDGDPATDNPDWSDPAGGDESTYASGGADPSPNNGGDAWVSSGTGSLVNSDSTLVEQSDVVCSWLKADTESTVGIWFGVQDANNLYYVYLKPAGGTAGELRVGKYVDGVATDFDTAAYSFQQSTWYLIKLRWYTDGTIRVTAHPGHDTDALATVSGTDTTYTSGGFGVEFTEANQYFDMLRLCGNAGILDSFEDGDLTEYQTAGGGSWSVVTDADGVTPIHGSYLLKGQQPDNTSAQTCWSESGLDAYPEPGDHFAVWGRTATTSEGDEQSPGVTWGPHGGSLWGNGDGYVAHLYNDDSDYTQLNQLKLKRVDGGSHTQLAYAKGANYELSTWYDFDVDWKSDGSMTVTTKDQNGNVMQQVSATDATYGGGGFGLLTNSGNSPNTDEASTNWFDYARFL